MSPDSTEAPATRIRKPHISLHNRIRMGEALNLSGARFKKDAASVKGFVGFMWTRGRFVFKKKNVGCSKNTRFCVEPGLTAPRLPRILTINYSSKKDSRRLGSSVLVMLEKMAKKKKRAEILPNGKAKPANIPLDRRQLLMKINIFRLD